MDLEHDDLLIDHIQLNDLLEYRVNLNLISTKPRNALKRALLQSGKWETHSKRFDEMKKLSFVELRDIAQLRVSDVRDLSHVGEATLVALIQELQDSLTENFPGVEVTDDFNDVVSLEALRLRISSSRTIEELTESMIYYQKTIGNITEREEEIWRSRLPWITDKPKTLDSIGVALGVTRERIRQIQRKSSKYSYEVNSKVFVLSEVQNILLGCTNYEEFREAMIEDELTREESITIGRIRYLAVELEQVEVVSEVEKTIYAWSKG